MYARVVKVIMPEGDVDDISPMSYKYEIDIGKKKNKIVPSLELFRLKEYRLKEIAQQASESDVTALQLYAGDDDSSSASTSSSTSAAPGASASSQQHSEEPQTLDEIKFYIKKLLKEAQAKGFSDVEKKKLCKRLYLQFHPDKNPHRVEITTEAFKFLKHMADKLDKGEDLSDDDAFGSASGSDYCFLLL